MRAVTFRSVMERAIRRRGLDPAVGVQQSTRLAVGEYIDQHVRDAWMWSMWPEVCVWQYRPIRPEWDSATGYPLNAEVFYADHYYRCKQENTGNDPTSTAYWDRITPEMVLDYNIKPQIDAVIDIRTDNPRLKPDATRVHFSEEDNKAYLLLTGSVTQLWFYVRLRCPRFSSDPWNATTTYAPGDVIYVESVGDCFACQVANSNVFPPNDSALWARQFLPAIFTDAVVLGTVADLFREDEQFDKANVLDAKALDALVAEQDRYHNRSLSL